MEVSIRDHRRRGCDQQLRKRKRMPGSREIGIWRFGSGHRTGQRRSDNAVAACEQRGASLNARAGILNFPNRDCCHADICRRSAGLSERIEPGGYIPECFSRKPPCGFESLGQCRCCLHADCGHQRAIKPQSQRGWGVFPGALVSRPTSRLYMTRLLLGPYTLDK